MISDEEQYSSKSFARDLGEALCVVLNAEQVGALDDIYRKNMGVYFSFGRGVLFPGEILRASYRDTIFFNDIKKALSMKIHDAWCVQIGALYDAHTMRWLRYGKAQMEEPRKILSELGNVSNNDIFKKYFLPEIIAFFDVDDDSGPVEDIVNLYEKHTDVSYDIGKGERPRLNAMENESAKARFVDDLEIYLDAELTDRQREIVLHMLDIHCQIWEQWGLETFTQSLPKPSCF